MPPPGGWFGVLGHVKRPELIQAPEIHVFWEELSETQMRNSIKILNLGENLNWVWVVFSRIRVKGRKVGKFLGKESDFQGFRKWEFGGIEFWVKNWSRFGLSRVGVDKIAGGRGTRRYRAATRRGNLPADTQRQKINGTAVNPARQRFGFWYRRVPAVPTLIFFFFHFTL